MSHHPTISVCYAKPNKRTAYRSLIIIWSTPTLTVTALANWRWQACESPSTDTPYMLLLMKPNRRRANHDGTTVPSCLISA